MDSFSETELQQPEVAEVRPSQRQVRYIGQQFEDDLLIVDLVPAQPEGTLDILRIEDVLDAAGAAISHFWILRNQTWIFNYFSPGCEVILGYSPAELHEPAAPWQSQIYSPDWNSNVKPVLEKLLVLSQAETKTLHRANIQFRFQRKDGTLPWLATALTCKYHASRDCWGITAVQLAIAPQIAAPQTANVLFLPGHFPSARLSR